MFNHGTFKESPVVPIVLLRNAQRSHHTWYSWLWNRNIHIHHELPFDCQWHLFTKPPNIHREIKKYMYISHRKCAKLYWYSRDMRRLMPFAHVCSRYGRSAIYSIHAFLTAKVQDRWQHVVNMNQMNQKVRTGCGMWNVEHKGPLGHTGRFDRTGLCKIPQVFR